MLLQKSVLTQNKSRTLKKKPSHLATGKPTKLLHVWNDLLPEFVFFIAFLLLRYRMDEYPLFSRRPSGDTLALAMCDPGLRRRHSSECEEDSLPEIYVDSGLSTLRGSHGGYDSEHEVKGQEEEDENHSPEKKKEDDDNNDSVIGELSDTEVRP